MWLKCPGSMFDIRPVGVLFKDSAGDIIALFERGFK
jgi:hypothetical protein